MERNTAFDRFRGIGAVCVVLLHAPPFYHSNMAPLRAFGWGLRDLCQCAVPFFFLLSGWLMGTKWVRGREGWDEFARSAGRLLRLYIPWFLFFLALDVAAGLPHDWGHVARRFVGFSDSAAQTRGYHLWFLPSLVLAELVCWGLLRLTRSIVPALGLGLALYVILAWRDLHGLELPWGLAPHEGIDLSLPCVALGIWLGIEFSGWPVVVHRGMLAAAFGLLLLEGAALDRFGGSTFSIHPFQAMRIALPALLLLWLARHPLALGAGAWGRVLDFLGRHSTGIYVIHLAFLALIPFDRLVSNGFVRDNLVRWPVAIVGSVAVSVLLGRAPWAGVRKLVS
jgi:peptidoglycan/LPS O-acetylase OafA/YrhL